MRLIFCFCLMIHSLAALEVGHVDFNRVLLLHPQMTHFHFGVGLFFKQPKGNKQHIQDMEMLSQSIGALTREFKQDHQKSKEEMVEQQRQALQNLPSNSTSDPTLLSKTNQYMKSIEAEYAAIYRAKKLEFLQTLQSYWDQYFLSPAESRLKLRSLNRSLEGMVLDIKNKQGLSLLIRKSGKLLLEIQDPDFSDLENLVFHLNQGLEGVLIKLYEYQPDFRAMQREHSKEDIYFAMKNRMPVDELLFYLDRYQQSPLVDAISGEMKDFTLELLAQVYQEERMNPDQFLPLLSNLP